MWNKKLNLKWFWHNDQNYFIISLKAYAARPHHLTTLCLLLSRIVSFKEGKPSYLDLSKLAGKIAAKWETLGIHLGIGQDILDEMRVNANDKPYQMLVHWRRTTNSATPYEELYHALCHVRVSLNNVAREFCCKETT